MGKSKSKSRKSVRKSVLDVLNTVPDVVEFHVETPEEEETLELRCVSTDKLVDVRIVLSELPNTCHVTNYSFRHTVRGDELKDDTEVISLKPRSVAIQEESYTYDKSIEHVQRFADLFSSTNLLGPPASKKPKPTDSWLHDPNKDQKLEASLTPSEIKKRAGNESGKMWEEPLLSEFYSYFSFADLPKPLDSIKVVAGSDHKDGECFFELDLHVAGEVMRVVACEEGYHMQANSAIKKTTLVELAKGNNETFSERYAALIDGFKKRNEFGNPPLGLRANSWVVPQCLSEPDQGKRSLLPADDAKFNGGAGGFLSDDAKERDWYSEFLKSTDMPGSNPAERVARDRRVFLLHSHFVDTAIVNACSAASSEDCSENIETDNILITSEKEATKISVDCGSYRGMPDKERFDNAEQSLIKGLLADENTIARDVDNLASVKVHFNGRNISATAKTDAKPVEPWSVEEEPALNHYDCLALNTHALRKFCVPTNGEGKDVVTNPSCDLLESVLSESTLSGEPTPPLLRWEIVSSWVQYLRNPPEEGPGSIPVKSYALNRRLLLSQENRSGSVEGEAELREKLGDAKWNQLAKMNIGLHRKNIAQLLAESNRYYAEIALPRIVHDFMSLELSPIDGQTLTDFMHTRGVNMRHIGRLAALSHSLVHVYSLCIQEMIIRAVKRVFRAIMAKVKGAEESASALSGTLNALLGSEGSPMSSELWKWIHAYVKHRFDFDLPASTRSEIRHLALLRDLCQRLGLEIVSKSFDFSSKAPFAPQDVIALVPVCKYVQFTSADGRQLLEYAKSALDKGKLDEAVSASTSALSKMCAVCGSHHRASASAFSLLAVVLYHTGDFLQAAIYQQKALAVNEREYGLDHPDTIKSYGDLAVFFYRLQHTELALHYVSRALYLLHLTCGANHPNTAATYINVAMMEEGLGNIHVALRYLQEALHINQKLLGPDHVQTAASYHAIAIALSLMEPPLYTLSMQHEQTTLDILERKLGPDDLRTQDAAAWLEYFDLKAAEAQEASKSGNVKPDCNIACKGHLPVKDLMKFIFDDVPGEDGRGEQPITPDSTLYALVSESGESGSTAETTDSDAEEEEKEEEEEEETIVEYSQVAEKKHSAMNGNGIGNGLAARERDGSKDRSALPSNEKEDEDTGEWVCVESNGKKREAKRKNSRNKNKYDSRPHDRGNSKSYKQKPSKSSDTDGGNRSQGRTRVHSAPSVHSKPKVMNGNGVLPMPTAAKAVAANNKLKLNPNAEAFVPTLACTDFNPNAKEFVPTCRRPYSASNQVNTTELA